MSSSSRLRPRDRRRQRCGCARRGSSRSAAAGRRAARSACVVEHDLDRATARSRGRRPRARGARAARRAARRSRAPAAKRRTTGSSRSTITGASPRLSSSSSISLRRARERACDREHLLLAARQEADAPALQLPQRREVLVREGLVELLAAMGEAEVLGDGQAEEEPAALRDVGDAEPCPRARRRASEIACRRTATRPAIGLTSPEIARSVVVLPAPFAPSSATTSPAATVRSTSRITAALVVAGGQALDREHASSATLAGAPRRRGAGASVGGRAAEVRGDHPRVAADDRRARRARSPCRTRARRPRRRSRARGPCRGRRAASPGRASTSARSRRPSSSLSCVSSPAAGSSRQTSRGFATSARAMPTSLRCPCDSSLGSSSTIDCEPEQLEHRVDLRGVRAGRGRPSPGASATPTGDARRRAGSRAPSGRRTARSTATCARARGAPARAAAGR